MADNCIWTSLCNAVIKGHRKKLEELLKSDTEIDLKDKKGCNLLVCAAEKGHFEIALDLLKAGADWNVVSYSKNTALHYAAMHGHKELVETLVNAGAPVDMKNESGCSPFYYAVLSGHCEIALYLFKAGADWNVVGYNKYTALHYAAMHGHKELVETLVNAGAPVDMKNESGCSPFYYAVERGHCEIALYLFKAGADWNVVVYNNYTALHVAAMHGHNKELVKTLVKAGALVEAKNENGSNPLYFAARNSNNEIFDFLHNSLLEIERMKDSLLGNSVVTLFKFLRERDDDKVVNYLVWDGVVKDLKNYLSGNQFAVHNDLIRRQYLKGQERKNLFEFFEKIMIKGRLQILNFEIWKIIFRYLSNDDLFNLRNSFAFNESLEKRTRSGKGLKRKSSSSIL